MKIKCLLCGKILEAIEDGDMKICGCSNETMINIHSEEFITLGGKDADLVEILKK